MSYSPDALRGALTRLGTSITASQAARDADRIENAREAIRAQTLDRDEHIRSLRAEGWTLQQIAEYTKLTPQAVHKIINADSDKENI